MMVGIYARVSTQEQAKEGYSIDEQVSRLNAYCKSMGWSIYETYVDAGFTGANMDRPSLRRMLNAVSHDQIKKVVVYKLDRLSRSQLDTLKIIEELLLPKGCDFVSMSENFDTGTPFGKAMIGILAVFAQLEREQIKERMSMGMLARAKEGLPHGGIRIPFGYDYKNGRLVVNDREASQLQLIFQLYADGHHPKEIAEMLNERGLSGKEGGIWWENSVRRIIKSKTCLGYIHYKGEWYKGEHPPIIDADLFKRVETISEQRSKAFADNRRTGKATSLLGGLLFCAKCGAKFHKKINPHGTYYVCYSRSKKNKDMIRADNCRNKIWRMEELDSIILSEIRKLETDPSAIDEIKPADTKTPMLAELDRIDDQMSKLIDLYSMGKLPPEMLSAKIDSLSQKRSQLLEDIERETEHMTKEQTMCYLDSFGAAIDHGSTDDIRGIICGLIKRIELDGEDITIYWNFN